MDHIKILKRAFTISWNYRVLWIFGILLALTTARGGGNNGGGGGGGSRSGVMTNGFPNITLSQQTANTLIAVGISLVCLVLLLVIAAIIVHYVSETALIKLVDRYEASGEKVSIRKGFREGWNRAALRLFGMDLLILLAAVVALTLGLLVAAAPLLFWLTHNQPLEVFGTLLAIGLGLIVIFIAILVAIALSLLRQFFHRACVLENLGVFESLRHGATLVRQRLGDVIILGLILFAMGLGALILLIPVAILAFIAAIVSGGLPALLVWAIASLFTQGVGQNEAAIILAAIVGTPIFLLVLIAPLAFLGGLIETYQSTTWTLTFREALALTAAKSEPEAEAA